MKKLLYFVIIVALVICCASNEYRKLCEADIFVSKNLDDSALVVLSTIAPDALKDSMCRAYYSLIKAQSCYRTDSMINYDDLLNYSIRYYENQPQSEQLARSYYYKASILNDKELYSDAVLYAKKGQVVAEHLNLKTLRHHIYNLLAYINFQTENFQQSLLYNKKALALSYTLGNDTWLFEDKITIATAFDRLNMDDSSTYYTLMTFDVDKTDNKILKTNALDNIAVHYLNRKMLDSAEFYIKKSFAIEPSTWSYRIYGNLKKKQGKPNEAYKLWEEASNTDIIDQRIMALRWMAEYKKEKGLYKDATMLNDTIKMLSDSLKARQRSEEVAQLQSNMHREDDRRRADERLFATIIWAVVIAVVLVAAVVVMKVKMTSAARQIAQGNKKIAEYEKSIDEARKAGRDSEKEVARLQRKIEDLRERQSRILAHGKQLYGEIVHGGNAAKWSRGDFEDCVGYLRTLYPQRLHDIERQYAKLTAHNIFFVVMKDNGFEDDEMAQMLNSSIGAIRTMKSRIHNKKIA